MAGKVGLVMLQFEYLNRKKVGSQAEFLEKLQPFLTGRPRTAEKVKTLLAADLA